MKHNFLTIALEEAGLVEPAVEPTAVSEQEIVEFVESASADTEAMAEKTAELDNVIEVQEGLEALVTSMESALADPNYSAREYRLQVSHAAALLGRIGLGLPAGYSCESTDGAEAAKEGFADKAKKLGKVVLEYIKKLLEWIRDTAVAKFKRTKEVFGKLAVRQKKAVEEDQWFAGNEFVLLHCWGGAKFDPKDPLAYARRAQEIMADYNKLLNDTCSKVIRGGADISSSDLKEILNQYHDSLSGIIGDSEKNFWNLSVKEGVVYDMISNVGPRTLKTEDTKIDFTKTERALHDIELSFNSVGDTVNKLIRSGNLENLRIYFIDAKMILKWAFETSNAVFAYISMYTMAGTRTPDKS